MGALVTLRISDDSPLLELPWIITYGPLGDDENWEPVVSGPYERPHALALAQSVVADENVMAVVEPLMPHISTDEMRNEISAARISAAREARPSTGFDPLDALYLDEEEFGEEAEVHADEPPTRDQVMAAFGRIAVRLTAPRDDAA